MSSPAISGQPEDDSSRGPRTRRPFTLLDGMVLVAATAVASRWSGVDLHYFDEILLRPNEGWTPSAVIGKFHQLQDVFMPYAASWMIALLGLWLRRPHPTREDVATRPGFVACLALALSLVLGTSGIAIVHLVQSMLLKRNMATYPFTPGKDLLEILLFWPGPMVVAAWTTLIVGGRWRAERSWLDRSGRILGVFWIWAIFDLFLDGA